MLTIPFYTPMLQDRAAVCEAVNAAAAMENDAAFAGLYLLRRKYQTEIALQNGILLRRYGAGVRKDCYGFPLGGDPMEGISLCAADAESRGLPLRFGLLTEEMCQTLSECFPDSFSFTEAEGYSEYLYLRENIATLKGSRYHKKRNHIAQFRRGCPDAEIQPLVAANADFAVHIARKWLENRENPAELSVQAEFGCIQEAAANWNALGLSGLLLYADGKPIGMTIVSEISEGVMDIHFEKVIPDYPHAWPVVANEMAKCLPDAKYLNREEDLGESGMRASKISYHPDVILKKYFAQWCGKERPTC